MINLTEKGTDKMATASQMIKEAYALVGQPYLWGGNGETLEEIIRKYADGKGQGKSATDDMIKFLKGIIPVGLDTHFQDCSGMVIEILRKLGVIDNKYDTNAEGLWRTCKKIDKPCEGAWAFYFDGKKHNHIGICVNNLTVIHCLSTKTGVIVEPIERRKEKWVDFGLPTAFIDFSFDTVTLKDDVWVYRTAKEAEEKKDTSTKLLYKKGEYYKFKTYGNCTNISKKPDVAGGWISNFDLHSAEEW